jgi:hypothetical protein
VRRALALIVIALVGCSSPSTPQPDSGQVPESPPAKPNAIDEFAQGKRQLDGMFAVLVDDGAAKVYLILPAPDENGHVAELIYVEGLVSGLGSNEIGLDRGQLGGSRYVRFRRIGGRLFIEQPNLGYRALSDNAAEVDAVRQSFATSVLWSGKIAATDEDGRFVVDFTDFVVRDAHGVSQRLARAKEGSFKLDYDRSAVDTSALLAFPDNLEFEALLTFGGTKPGSQVSSVTPSPESITLTQHHSLIRLPEPGYQPRRFDPRAGSFATSFLDYAVPIAESMQTNWINRHRLEKTNSGAAPSSVVEPIVYYVDPGAPPKVRDALIDGASWWADAFETAGFKEAFRVEVLPENAHPLDVRYNVIQWVHRSTRGWSYGGAVVDPRSGEIIKGHVSLGSLRVRQDRRIFEGLLGAGQTGSGADDDPVELALARIRQLAAHEVGHTIGLRHNFAASTYGGRASVMDYPAPLIGVDEEGRLDASNAYGVGVGIWDEFSIRYAYSMFDTEDESALEVLVQEALAAGLHFGGDQDARPRGSSHPTAHLWDNGDDPATELAHTMEVRSIALSEFGPRNVTAGTPLAELQETFALVYFYHRYQVEAAAKLVGGVDYRFNLTGDGQPLARPVDGEIQRTALAALIAALDPAELEIADSTLAALTPSTVPGHGRSRERVLSNTAPNFDSRGAALSAMDMVVSMLLVPERCTRLNQQSRLDHTSLSLDEVLDELHEVAFDKRARTERLRSIQRGLQSVLVARMIERASNTATPDDVRAVIEIHLSRLQRRLARRSGSDGPDAAHDSMLARQLDRYLNQHPWSGDITVTPLELPPGSPIGSPGFGDCNWHDR